MHRRVFVKGPMSSGCVIVARVGAQQMAQMRLAKDNHVVQAFPANGPNQSFGKTVLPRRPRRVWLVPNAHCPIRRDTSEPKTRSRSRITYPEEPALSKVGQRYSWTKNKRSLLVSR